MAYAPAIELARSGHLVELFERQGDILGAASGINQFRVHRGYHYPRSSLTARICQRSSGAFEAEFASALMGSEVTHYYCVAADHSRTSVDECQRFWRRHRLPFDSAQPHFVNPAAVALCVQVDEDLLDPTRFREICRARLAQHEVQLRLNTTFTEHDTADYDAVVVAVYAQTNTVLSQLGCPGLRLKYMLSERVLLSGVEELSKSSAVVLDGDFGCINPLGRSGLCIAGHVSLSSHATNTGYGLEIPENYRAAINCGPLGVDRLPATNWPRIQLALSQFFPALTRQT